MIGDTAHDSSPQSAEVPTNTIHADLDTWRPSTNSVHPSTEVNNKPQKQTHTKNIVQDQSIRQKGLFRKLLKRLVKMKFVALNDGVSALNFATFMIHSFWTVGLLIFLNSMQPYLLTDLYDVGTDDIGQLTGVIGLVDEVWSIVCLGLWGALSDKFGRRTIAALGYIQVAIALALLPLGTDVYAHLLPLRLLYAQGAAALTTLLTSLLADYVQPQDRGKGGACLGVASGLGAIVFVFMLVGEAPKALCISNTYYLTAGMTLLISGVAWYGLDKNKFDVDDNLCKLIKDGFVYTKQNPKVTVAYYSGFLARSGSILLSSFITLWVASYYIDNDLCSAEGHSSNITESLSTCGEVLANPDKIECPEAFSTGSSMTGIAQTVGLLCVPIIGILLDRSKNLFKSFAWMSLFSAASYLSSIAVTDPSQGFVLGLSALWGTSQLGMVMLSQVLITKEMPESMRGTISGCYSLIGAFGVMTCSYIGGLLFDIWQSYAPFVLNGALNLVGVAIALLAVQFWGSPSDFLDTTEKENSSESSRSSGGVAQLEDAV